MIGQTLLPQPQTGFADYQYFGMGRGVGQFAGAVASLRDHLPVSIYNDSAHGYFTARRRRARLIQRDMHVRPKAHIPSCDVKATFARRDFILNGQDGYKTP